MKRFKLIVISIFLLNTYLFSTQIETAENVKTLLNKNYNTVLIKKKILQAYYKKNDFQLFWVDERGVKDIALNLIETIKNDPVLKTNTSKIFKLEKISNNLIALKESNENYFDSLIKIDFMMTEIYSKYSSYLLKGSINWKLFKEKLEKLEKDKEINAQWDRYKIKKDPKELLKQAIKDDDLSIALKELDSTYLNRKELINAINDLELIIQDGDYIKLPKIKILKIGDQSETVKILRERLTQSKDLTKICTKSDIDVQNLITNTISIEEENQENDSIKIEEEIKISCEEVFDEDLKKAVISFQKNHGLYADGIVGNQTRKFLNKSAKEKIGQIRLNLERMRWLPRDFGDKYLLINIPEYKLKLVENNNIKLSMEVIVGEKKYPTPIFSDKMSYIVLNPNWNIPQSITKKEILPKLLKDPDYLTSKGIDIYQGWHKDSEKVEVTEVLNTLIFEDVNAISNYRFTQGPSLKNPLGRMKFMFPNKHAVYLHDTPAKYLFKNSRRAYSHGCIRLFKPEKLLSTIALDDKNTKLENANEILKEENEKSIGLNKKIPVHIVYLTSWVDEKGILQFREDIYNYDKIQEELMF